MRALRLLIPIVVGALALTLHGGATAPAAVTTLYADVGPGYTITLKDAAGAAVTKLTPGTYAIVVNDQAADHNFHLTGPGGVDLSTTVPFIGQVTWTVDLVAGSYRFVCDPHADGMLGDFTVAAADTTPPDTSIATGPAGSVNTTSASFAFSSTESGSTFECALDTAAFAACTSPKAYTALAQGQHTFQVRATDAAGNVDPSPASRVWTIDTVAPDTTIASGPSGTVGATSATFGFSSNDSGASFQCALDSTTAYSPCTSPKTYSGLASGAHTFRVRAADGAGNVDATPASRSWTINATPPDTTITAAPTGVLTSGDASFEFTSTKAGSTFQCALDAEAFAACSSPQLYSALSDGDHTFQVRATDSFGNVDPTPASASWTIDTTAPETVIDVGPIGSVNTADASISFSASEPGSTFECSLDGGAYEPCSSPASYTALTEGAHSFEVRATDAVGNLDTTPAGLSWTIDTAAPDTTIDSGPLGTVGQTTANFAFSAGEPGSTFECALDGAAFSACSSPASYTGLAEGAHSFQVRATDPAGNVDPTPSVRDFAINTTALYGTDGPGFTITLTDAAGAPVTSLKAGTYTIVVHDNASSHNFHLSGAGVDRSTTVPFVGEQIWTVTLTGGRYRFQCDPHPGMEGTFDVVADDTTPPETTIEGGPAGTVASGAASFSFSASEPGASFACALDGGAYAACTSPQAYSGLLDGTHTFQVRATDAAGNTDPTPAGRSWSIDTSPPDTTIDGGPSSLVTSASASFSFSGSEPGSSFECSLDGGAYAACSSPQAYSGLADGTHAFRVRAVDLAGNTDTTPAERSWTIDAASPDTTIQSGPSGTVAANTAAFAFSANEPGVTFECSLDGGAFAVCSSLQSYSGLADGPHTFEVRAIDLAGNADPTPAGRTWTIDTAAPDTTIESGPSGTVASSSASFVFAASEASATFECALDGAAFAACSSPQSYGGLADGSHSFQVRATDAAGNADASPASRSWNVDGAVPDTAIESGPSGTVTSSSAAFAFSATKAGSSFECSLDGAAYASCSSPQSYSGLADGLHSFGVRAIDALGTADPTPAGRSWTIDTAAPETTIESGPASLAGSSSASFVFGASEPGASFECSLDGAAFAACSSPQSYSGLADGAHSFQVRSADAAGNADATPAARSWTIDSAAPETTIDSAPDQLVTSGAAAFAFSASEAGADFECALDGAAFAACSSPQSYSGLGDGAHSFQVRAKDAAGNADPTPASRSWTIDTGAPETTIDSGPTSLVGSSSASFAFAASEPGASFECALDGAPYTACSSPQSYSGVADGAHSFQVRATDTAGNADASPASRSWTIDTVAPDTSITAGPTDTVSSSSGSFEFDASEAEASFQCALDGAAFAACSSPQSYSGLADGAHAFEVRATDALGNVDPTPASRTWTIDTGAPETTIDSGPTSVVGSSSASFVFSASETGASFECALDGAAFAACSSPQSYSGLADGAHAFDVRATDAAGNADASPANRSWTIDTVAPDTSITAGPTDTVSSSSASFEFSASEAEASFECALDGAAFAACSSPQSYSGLADGAHSFQVRATDAAGNLDPTPAGRSWTIDSAAPETAIDSGPSGTIASSSAAFAFSATKAGSSFECSLDGAAFAACSSPQSYSGLADGTHAFRVRATDAVGNADPTPASRSWTVDTAAPDTSITAGPSDAVGSASAGFTFSASEAGSSFECSLDGAAFAACSSPQTYSGLADGAHTFDVRAKDAAGNADASPASRSWTIDTAAPETSIDAGPSGTVESDAASFDFSAGEPGSSFRCSLDGSAPSACTSPKSYTGLAAGPHTFEVRATDAVGNADPTPASRSWTIQIADTAAPETTIDSGPAPLVGSSSATLTFSASEAGSSFECALDGAPFAACSSPQSYDGLADGAHTFQVRARDAAGNADATPAARGWTVDITAPDTTITAGPSGTVDSASASFEFAAGEPGARFECALDGGAFAACSSPKSYSGIANGGHTFAVRAIDAAGNADVTPADRAWTVQVTAPAPATLYGQVGPGSTISLKDASGSLVTHLEPGTYSIAVRDLSRRDNFHLRGPGVNQKTPVRTTVEVLWTVTFVPGTYTYRSDGHERLRGKFTVGAVNHENDDDDEEEDD